MLWASWFSCCSWWKSMCDPGYEWMHERQGGSVGPVVSERGGVSWRCGGNRVDDCGSKVACPLRTPFMSHDALPLTSQPNGTPCSHCYGNKCPQGDEPPLYPFPLPLPLPTGDRVSVFFFCIFVSLPSAHQYPATVFIRVRQRLALLARCQLYKNSAWNKWCNCLHG